MDGITPRLPWTAARASIHVPYLAGPLYQLRNTSFEDFAARNGYPQTEDAGDLINGCQTIDSLTTFFQSWLFFELLSTFLGHEIDRDNFATGGFIDLDKEIVHQYFREWQRRFTRLSPSRKQLAKEELQALIKKAFLKSEIFEEAADHFGVNDEHFDRVALSVKLLISLLSAISDDVFSVIGPRSSGIWAPWIQSLASRTIGWASPRWKNGTRRLLGDSLVTMGHKEARRHLQSQQNKFQPFLPGVDRGGRAAERLYRQFVNNGWCPYRALQFCQSYDYLVLNNLAGLKNDSSSIEDHGKCLELQTCYAHALIDGRSDGYPFQHDIDCSNNCEFVHAPRKEITKIIKSGGIPIISVSLENELDLQVVRCTPYTTYTAVSHVWSDGLGNPQANSMPYCQLLRLRKMIYQSYFPEYSPFYDDSTTESAANSVDYWRSRKAARASKPYFNIDRKRVYFWMDTLCIPVPVESLSMGENKDLKFRAMKHITPVFAGAFNTLILDKGLQTISVPNPSQVSGDEFAAFVLSSKWMQRGWTLEEGALSSSCAFQIMGKPYEISGSLSHLLPKVETNHSPLERVVIDSRQSIPELLKRALLDDKKMLSNNPSGSTRSRLAKLLRIPQFVWTWNSLLERSTTKLHDGPIILANLLDFNVFALKSLSHEDRLKSLIQNCDELPLSLLYNTGPRILFKECPELGWIPKNIAGDHLLVGAALRRINPKGNSNQVKFFIDRLDTNPESFFILKTPPTESIPYDTEVFVVRARTRRGESVQQEYIIEIQRPQIERPDDEDARRFARRAYGQSQGTCILIDLACGAPSRRGYVGKGTRFYVDSQTKNGMFLKYDAPLIAWTPDQWQRQYGHPPTAVPCFEMEHVRRRQQLLLKYNAFLWGERLVRRTILTQHPPAAKTAGIIVFLIILILAVLCIGFLFVTIREALGFRARASPHSSIAIQVLGPIFTMFIYHPIRRRVAMYAYISWLKSFEEDYMQSSEWRSNFLHSTIAKISRLLPRWRRQPLRGVTQVNINLPLLAGPENSPDELPGEIFLQ